MQCTDLQRATSRKNTASRANRFPRCTHFTDSLPAGLSFLRPVPLVFAKTKELHSGSVVSNPHGFSRKTNSSPCLKPAGSVKSWSGDCLMSNTTPLQPRPLATATIAPHPPHKLTKSRSRDKASKVGSPRACGTEVPNTSSSVALPIAKMRSWRSFAAGSWDCKETEPRNP